MRTTPTVAVNTNEAPPALPALDWIRANKQGQSNSRPSGSSVCICPRCGQLVSDEELAAQGYSPSDPKAPAVTSAVQAEAARIAQTGEPDDDDLAAQKTIDDFNEGREGDYYRARPGVASKLLGAARRLKSSREIL